MKKVVLITGTSSGFGRASAETLARRGYSVIATMRDCSGRNSSASEALQSFAEREKCELRVLDMDITSDASVGRAIDQALSQVGRIDVVINNAGVAAVGITEAFTVEQLRQVLDVNLLGALRVNRAVLPTMRRQRSGLLIHVSSVAGRVVLPGFAAYSASKFALEAVADVYRYELSQLGIESVVVEPGPHKSPMTAKTLGPDDPALAASYGEAAETVNRILGIFQDASTAPGTPGPELVVESFIRLIETPAGERPFRTVPTPSMQPLLENYNVVSESLRNNVSSMFGISTDAARAPFAVMS